MIYRVDYLPENKINPITGQEYDSSWIAFTLTCSVDNRAITGMGKEGVYFIRVSRFLNDDWQLSVGDFIGYCEANALNGILVMSESDYDDSLRKYDGHSYNESVLRKDEALVLIHSTTADCWKSIQHDGALKSWNQLKRDSAEWESKPIGAQLGDLAEFSDYIMFGGGVSGEIVVSSKLSGFINMDVNAEYHTGARLYFDAKKMAEDGMLVRDGAHVKVKGSLPLEPYLMWVATWDKLGLNSPLSTPKIFAESADERFRVICKLFGLPCYCGHDCSKCVTYIATQTNSDDLRRQAQNFYKETFGLDIPLEKFYCDGGRSKNVFELCKECPFKKCCIERGIDACRQCSEYPCRYFD